MPGRRLTPAGPAELARLAAATGWTGDAASWAADAWTVHVSLDGLPVAAARALSAACRGLGLRCVVAGGRALVAGPHAALRSLAVRLATALDASSLAALAGTPPAAAPPPLQLGPHRLDFGRRTHVMAIVNLTADSFSDDSGRPPDPEEAERQARAAVAAGADLVDLGAESSEQREHGCPDPAGELARLLPVLDRLRGLAVPISVDTRHGAVARQAIEHGATLINDVSAGADPELLATVAAAGVGLVVMHDRARAEYADLVGEVVAFLAAAVDRAAAAGVARERIVVDAGFGFAKTVHQDLELTRRLGELRSLGRPILHAPSRKRTIGRVLGFPETIPERLPGTAAAVALGVAAGADLVRVHDVSEMVRVVRMADAIVRAAYDGEP